MTDPSSDLRLFVVNTAAQTRLEVGGELDVGTVGPLRDHLDALIDNGIGAVYVDMSLVTFCDSTTLSVLAGAFTRLREAQRPMRVINPSPSVARVLQLSGLDTLLLDGDQPPG